MTREATKEFVRQHSSLRDKADNWNWLIDKIYDDFEEELKKAYVEGSNDAWKIRDESIEKAIVSVEDNYGWMTHEDKQNCIEILYGLRG